MGNAAIRLIVNADDFGFTRDVNAGIVEAHLRGIVTATTLMANGDAFDDAVDLARKTPTLDVGCHLVLVQGRSVLNPCMELPDTFAGLSAALLRRELPVYAEISAQIRKILAAGIQPSHLDTHQHTHLLPPVLRAVARAAREFGVPWVRRPWDFGTGATTRLMQRAIPSSAELDGLRMTDFFTGFGNLTKTLRRLPPGLTEYVCHPGHPGPELNAAKTRLKASRGTELAALLSPGTRQQIEQRGISLVNYRQILAIGLE